MATEITSANAVETYARMPADIRRALGEWFLDIRNTYAEGDDLDRAYASAAQATLLQIFDAEDLASRRTRDALRKRLMRAH